MPFLGETAPAFRACSTCGEINFPLDYNGKWVILFRYIGDYSPVCTTEMMIFASMINEFKGINTQLIGLSADSLYSHIAWIRKIKELAWKDMKRVEVTFPLISDTTHEIAQLYGMEQSSAEEVSRSVYLLDPQGRLRAKLHYPAAIGVNVKELLRMLVALQKAETEGALIPSGWNPQDDVILKVPDSCVAASERIEKVNEDVYCLDWFLSFKQANLESESGKIPEFNPFPSGFAPDQNNHMKR